MTTVGKRHRPLRDEVVDELRKAILDGTYAAGARLTELAVAEELGVSRLPVREAFRKLEAEGLLEAVPRRGVRVTSATAEELEAVHEIRMAMELLAVRRTVRRRDPDVLRRLSDALEEGER
ncbi:GntR family transcriptional regulator, partial [Streptomyces shenzhenensis]